MPAKTDMLSGHAGMVVLRMTVPMIAAAMSIVAFNLVDTYFVGQLGAVELAAMSYSFPVVLITGSLALGVGIGASTRVSNSLGAGERESARRYATRAHLLAVAIGVALSILGILTTGSFFRMLGAGDEVMPYIRDYVTIWYFGIPFVIVPMIGQSVIQATGDTRTPAIIVSLAVALNIVLDPALIFGLGPFPAMGIAGAALATVLARGSSLILVVLVLWRRDHLFSRHIGKARELIRSWGELLHIGVPAAAINVLQPVSIGFVTRLVSGFGTAAVAGFGAATRLESFGIVFMIALSMVFTPFSGQNFGAGKPERIRRGFRFGALYCILWGLLVLTVFLSVARPLSALFSSDPVVITVTADYLRILSLSYAFQGIVLLTSAAFNGVRRPGEAFAVSFLRLIVFYIPLAAAGRVLFGLTGIFVGIALANFLSGVLALLWFHRTIDRVGMKVDGTRRALSSSAPTASRPGEAGSAERLRSLKVPVLYRDEHVIVVDKPPGLMVHTNAWERRVPNCVNILGGSMQVKVRTVHRLDRRTSGVLLFALSKEGAASVSELLKNAQVDKRYLAVVRGHAPQEGLIERSLSVGESGEALPARTAFRRLKTSVLERAVGPYREAWFSLLELDLLTGKRHQARRHLHSIDHPVIGDPHHGDREWNGLVSSLTGRQMLYLRAFALSLSLPHSGERLSVQAGLPGAWIASLDRLGLSAPAELLPARVRTGSRVLFEGPACEPADYTERYSDSYSESD